MSVRWERGLLPTFKSSRRVARGADHGGLNALTRRRYVAEDLSTFAALTVVGAFAVVRRV